MRYYRGIDFNFKRSKGENIVDKAKNNHMTAEFVKLLPVLVSLLLAAGMTAVAEITGEKEIIFPEITAIAIGALAAPVQSWNTSRIRLFAAIVPAAFVGIAIVKYLHVPLWVQVTVGLICAVAWITLLRTEFVPAISACVLPILMGTKSVVYVLSIVVMTALILAAQLCFEHFGIRQKYDFHEVPSNRKLILICAKQTAAASIMCFLPTFFGQIFFIAPPLIVAFFELSKPQSKLRKRAAHSVILISSAAVAGVLSRALLTELAGFPLALSAAVSCGIILYMVCRSKLYFPPCGAIATLPFLIPKTALLKFPFEVIGGYIIMVAVTFIFFADDSDKANK